MVYLQLAVSSICTYVYIVVVPYHQGVARCGRHTIPQALVDPQVPLHTIVTTPLIQNSTTHEFAMMRACALCLGGLAAFGVLEKPWNHSRSGHVDCLLPSLGIQGGENSRIQSNTNTALPNSLLL